MGKSWVAGAWAACIMFAASASAEPPSQAEREAAHEIYERLVSMDTSTEGRQNPAAIAYLAQRFRAAGFAEDDVRTLSLEDTAGLLVRYRGDGAGGPPILFLAHMDVVPARRADWVRDPFTLIEEDGFFFGRGASDNKSGLALIAATFLQLKQEGFTPTRDLIIWFSGDEETTGATTIALLRDHRDWLGEAEFALNSDAGGGLLNEADGRPLVYFMQTAEKTYASYTLTARNPGGHSSAPRADNAIYDLTDALARVRAYEFPLMWNDTTIGAFRAGAAMVGGEVGAALARFAQRPGDRRAAERLAREPSYNGQMRTTCVPTLLNAGHAENALPQTAAATVNCRIFPGVAPADVQAQLQRLAGAQIEVAPVDAPNSSDASPLREDVIAALTAAVHANYPGVPIAPSMSSGATDGVFFRGAGIPTYGVGEQFSKASDRFAHGLNERTPVQSFYNGLTHWRTLITELAGGAT